LTQHRMLHQSVSQFSLNMKLPCDERIYRQFQIQKKLKKNIDKEPHLHLRRRHACYRTN
jgi:hypothetical protein